MKQKRDAVQILVGRLLVAALFLFSTQRVLPVLAESSNSTNYTLWADSFNSGGSESGSSTNYGLTDTAGEVSGGDAPSSANFSTKDGFRQMEEVPYLTFSLSTTALELSPNPLTTDNVSTASFSSTVQTNAEDGWVVSIREDGEFRMSGDPTAYIHDVTDGAVSANSEEYGIRTGGTYGVYNSADTGISSTLKDIARNSQWTAGETTTVTLKAAIADTTPAGNYSHNLIMVATGFF